MLVTSAESKANAQRLRPGSTRKLCLLSESFRMAEVSKARITKKTVRLREEYVVATGNLIIRGQLTSGRGPTQNKPVRTFLRLPRLCPGGIVAAGDAPMPPVNSPHSSRSPVGTIHGSFLRVLLWGQSASWRPRIDSHLPPPATCRLRGSRCRCSPPLDRSTGGRPKKEPISQIAHPRLPPTTDAALMVRPSTALTLPPRRLSHRFTSTTRSLHGTPLSTPPPHSAKKTTPTSESCIKGHRTSSCNHTERPLFEIKRKGRPVSQCEKCRELRKTRRVHSKCLCSEVMAEGRNGQGSASGSGSGSTSKLARSQVSAYDNPHIARRFVPIAPAPRTGTEDVLKPPKDSRVSDPRYQGRFSSPRAQHRIQLFQWIVC